ncbi:MAG: hypothetical protein NC338_03820 [Firmicutes bacterium]|nr:hypothetical protein [Bacillota bacterium]MCM1400924.1 hypothetical protein [Bacteroides sp.]MCM1476612.1 hypothetical protein [Bacteroides sp.]
MRTLSRILFTAGICLQAVFMSGCDSVDSDRIPPVNVNVIFPTIGDWERYGVSGPGTYQRFIASERVPSGFPYKGLEGTGFGGLLLVCDPMGQLLVYDLACPVCVPAMKRIFEDVNEGTAGIFRCGNCGSTYDVFAQGGPHSGAALKDKYGLQRYRISVTQGSPYAIIGR